MNGKTLAGGYESEYIITWNRFATIGQGVNNFITAFSKDDEFGILSWAGCKIDLRFSFYLGLWWSGWFQAVAQQLKFFKLFQVDRFHSYLVKKIEGRIH